MLIHFPLDKILAYFKCFFFTVIIKAAMNILIHI